RPVQQVDDLVGEPVALVLAVLDPPDQLRALWEAVEQLDEQPGDLDGVRRRTVEQPEEGAVLRSEPEAKAHAGGILRSSDEMWRSGYGLLEARCSSAASRESKIVNT